jgi:secretion/DNA translocation related CpaE-like protein
MSGAGSSQVGTPRRFCPQVGRSTAASTAGDSWLGRARIGSILVRVIPVLLVTREDSVRDAVLRLAALAGTPVHLEAPGHGVRALWRAAGLVLVGPDGAGDAGLPRRDGVLLVTVYSPDGETWRHAVATGAEQVVVLPDAEHRLLDALAVAGEPVRARGVVVGVMGGCGGAGASTLSAALGLCAARDGSAILLDGDPLGGGLDVLLGAEHAPGARWPDLIGTRGRLSAPALLDAVVHVEGLAVLSWDRGDDASLPPEAASSVLDAAARGTATVILDLPRRLDVGTEVLLGGCDELILVVPATVRATAAAARVVARVSGVVATPGLVVREAGSPRLAAGDVGAALGLPVRAMLANDRAIATAAQQGKPPLSRRRGALHECCRSVLSTLSPALAAA